MVEQESVSSPPLVNPYNIILHLAFLNNESAFSMTGYATYMNIQFCLFHRLNHLKLSPRYTTDLMGVAVQVKMTSVYGYLEVVFSITPTSSSVSSSRYKHHLNTCNSHNLFLPLVGDEVCDCLVDI